MFNALECKQRATNAWLADGLLLEALTLPQQAPCGHELS
jgi:hypothetical protein